MENFIMNDEDDYWEDCLCCPCCGCDCDEDEDDLYWQLEIW